MNTTKRGGLVVLMALITAGCAGPNGPSPIEPSADPKIAAVTRRPLDAPAEAAPVRPAQPTPLTGSPPRAAPTPIALPPNALYTCVSERAGQRKETAIEFAPNVGALCRRHPEMGPCQYERDLCRRGGGRVFAANGQEITQQVEDAYDRKVFRARFRAN